MAELNPYARFLTGEPPVSAIASFPKKLTATVNRLDDAGLQCSSAPGKWTASQILCHMADVEIGFGFRLRQCIAETHNTTQPFDQDGWAWPYAHLDGRLALTTFVALRAWNAAWVALVPAEQWEKPFTHPERGTMTFRTIVETMAGHDENHYVQLKAIAER